MTRQSVCPKTRHTLNKMDVAKLCGAAPRTALGLGAVLQTYVTSALYNLFCTTNVQYDLIFITDFWGINSKFILFTAWDKKMYANFSMSTIRSVNVGKGKKKRKTQDHWFVLYESHSGTSRFTINFGFLFKQSDALLYWSDFRNCKICELPQDTGFPRQWNLIHSQEAEKNAQKLF